ncbi:hypothetical protein SCHPADRAFT_903922 [Schizopora paradoxa]|uniref:Cytochrome b561 domain-containing protein n=1 Tax=Schizopora paradoxa TaxID=27342 RepID=A0A0H2RP14_9AGAM|nr:hypothetical protein SCHPADRAFT_903922 [Schizopora paradoxa]
MDAEVVQLSPRELFGLDLKIKRHAVLCSVGFLILLPLGSLVARYLRTFTRGWFWPHALIQFVIAGPVIFAGWALAHQAVNIIPGQNFNDKHKKIGLALLILYLMQLMLGLFIHFVKLPFMGGHRPPQNYFHAILGLAIIALAFYQVHYGINTEWIFYTGIIIDPRAMHAWTALIVVFWVLYALGLALLPRQYKQESEGRMRAREEEKAI